MVGQACARARPGSARPVVRGTFSPARAWRPAVGPASARTLGVAKYVSIRPRLLALTLPIVAALPALPQTQAHGGAHVFACISQERLQCGCFIRLHATRCNSQVFSNQPHLFTELQLNTPLWINIDKQEKALPQVLQTGSPAKEDSSRQSRTVYRDEHLEVDIRYRPARSTCPASKIGGCEYSDVAVQVSIKRSGNKAVKYQGAGTCGC